MDILRAERPEGREKKENDVSSMEVVRTDSRGLSPDSGVFEYEKVVRGRKKASRLIYVNWRS